MLEQLDARQLVELEAFFSMEPFGDLRADFHTGQLVSMYVNAHKKKGKKASTPADFMLLTEHSKRKQSVRAKVIDAKGRFKALAEKQYGT